MIGTALGFYEGRPAAGETGDRQDVGPRTYCLSRLISIGDLCSRHIPCIVVQGRYDVVCPVRGSLVRRIISCNGD